MFAMNKSYNTRMWCICFLEAMVFKFGISVELLDIKG